jgi:hypothetical protein
VDRAAAIGLLAVETAVVRVAEHILAEESEQVGEAGEQVTFPEWCQTFLI